MIRDFFAGLLAGLRGDLIIWLLLIANAIACLYAYGMWFEASDRQLAKMRFELLGNPPKAAPDAPAAGAPSIPQVAVGTVNANANVRSAPSPNAAVLESLTQGQQVVVTRTGVGPPYRGQPWLEIQLTNNRTGYIWSPLVD